MFVSNFAGLESLAIIFCLWPRFLLLVLASHLGFHAAGVTGAFFLEAQHEFEIRLPEYQNQRCPFKLNNLSQFLCTEPCYHSADTMIGLHLQLYRNTKDMKPSSPKQLSTLALGDLTEA